jgi:hypothetical protein
MNLEQIDTSTTAGKAEVMRLAAEGRRVAVFYRGEGWRVALKPLWNWDEWDFAIIAEPVGPEEVWVPVDGGNSISGSAYCESGSAADHAFAMTSPGVAVRYIRADLAGEKG